MIKIQASKTPEPIGHYGAVISLSGQDTPNFKDIEDAENLNAAIIEADIFNWEGENYIDWMVSWNPSPGIIGDVSKLRKYSESEYRFKFDDGVNKGDGRFLIINGKNYLELKMTEKGYLGSFVSNMYGKYEIQIQSKEADSGRHPWSLGRNVTVP